MSKRRSFQRLIFGVSAAFLLFLFLEPPESYGSAGKGSADGFGGPVEVLAAFAPVENDGATLARLGKVVVTAHTETPGLGTLVTERKRQAHIRDFFAKPEAEQTDDQYTTASVIPDVTFKVDKDGGSMKAASGATVTSRAVAEAISRISRAYAAQCSEANSEE